MRKIIGVLLSLCVLFGTVAAATVSVSGAALQTREEQLFQAVKTAAENLEKTVDISQFGFDDAEIGEALSQAITRVTDIPELFYVTNSYAYTVKTLTLQYQYEDKATIDNKIKEIEKVAKELTEDLISAGISDVYKALLLHDRLALLCEYDNENLINDTLGQNDFTMYGALVEKNAVCEGYAKAYMYLLNKVGIESYLCESKTLRHVWNIVIIDGEKYHVDVTYDDPVYDVIGRVNHENFMLSTKQLLKTGDHTADDYDSSPKDKKYDNYYWKNSKTAFEYVNGKIYYFDNTSGTLKTAIDGKTIDTLTDKWSAGDKGNWIGFYTRLSSNGDNLYYSGNNAIYIFHTKTGLKHKIYTPILPGNLQIYGFICKEEDFIIEYNDSPNFSSALQQTNKRIVHFDLDEHKFSGLVEGLDHLWHYVINGVQQYKNGIFNIGGVKYYIKNGIKQNVTALVKGADSKQYYVKNGIVQNVTGIYKISNKSYYIKNGIKQNNTGLVSSGGKSHYVKNGVKQNVTGLYKIGAKQYYLKAGVRQNTTTLVKHGNYQYYVKNGIRQNNTALIKVGGKQYYVKNGVKQGKVTGLVKIGKYYYYIKSGIKQNNTGLIKHGNYYYYVKNGIRQNNTGLVKHGNYYYYVKNGVRQNNTGLVKHGNYYYHVSNGVKQNTTGLVKYGNYYYYVKNGVRQYSTTLVKHGNNYFYVKNGVVDFSARGLVKKGNTLYYVRCGKIDFSYSGYGYAGGVKYKIVKGIATAI